MAKISISDMVAQFASNTSINAKFQQIEDEFNNKVLYRDEVGAMSRDLDMGVNQVVNVAAPSSPNDAARLKDITDASSSLVSTSAVNTTIADSGTYYASSNVEGALQEVGNDITNLQVQGNKNKIINGDFDRWERGTSFSITAVNTYTADRWSTGKQGPSTYDIEQSLDVPLAADGATYESTYCLKATCTTAEPSPAATSLFAITYAMEGYDFRPFKRNTATISFWVKSDVTGVYSAALRNQGTDRAYISEITVNAVDTWEKKTITVPMNYTGGSWNDTTGVGIYLEIVLLNGSNWVGATDTWLSTNDNSSTNQENHAATIGNKFRLAQVQFEEGSVATPFEQRPIATEIALCQRYYYASPNVSNSLQLSALSDLGTGTGRAITLPFPVTMREAPTTTTVAGSTYSPTIAAVTAASMRCEQTAAGAGSIAFISGYTAEAEL